MPPDEPRESEPWRDEQRTTISERGSVPDSPNVPPSPTDGQLADWLGLLGARTGNVCTDTEKRAASLAAERLRATPPDAALLNEAIDLLFLHPEPCRKAGVEWMGRRNALVDSVTLAAASGSPGGPDAALRALSDAAAPGEWKAEFTRHGDPYVTLAGRYAFAAITNIESGPVADPPALVNVATGPDDYGKANAEFIAASVNFVRSLLAGSPGGAPEPLREQIATALRGAIKAEGTTQAEIAHLTLLTPKHVNQVVNGKAGGGWDVLDDLARALHRQWRITLIPIPDPSLGTVGEPK